MEDEAGEQNPKLYNFLEWFAGNYLIGSKAGLNSRGLSCRSDFIRPLQQSAQTCH